MTRSRRWLAAASAALFLGHAGAGAAGPQTPLPAGSESGTLVRQRLSLLEQLLHESSDLARRIRLAGNPDLTARLEAVRREARAAEQAQAAGRVDEALSQADAAMKSLARLSQTVPNIGQAKSDQRIQFEAQYRSTEAMLTSLERMQARVPREGQAGRDGPGEPGGRQQLAQARRFADSGDYLRGGAELDRLSEQTAVAMNRALGTTTLVYAPRFATPQKELEYEASRYLSYQRLIPFALEKMNPSAEVRVRVQASQDQARRRYEDALQQAQRKDFRAAIEAMQQAVVLMHAAMEQTGFRVQ